MVNKYYNRNTWISNFFKMEKKNNHGGARENSGRLKKNDVISMIEQMDKRLVPDTVWDSLAKLVEECDIQAIKTWLGYRYGQPKQVIDATTEIINEVPVQLTDEQFKKALQEIKQR